MIAALRAQLAADLAAVGVPVVEGWPDRLTAPCLIVVPPSSASYVSSGPNFGEYTIAMDVIALVDKGSSEVALPALEQLVEGVLANSVDWQLLGCDSPSLVTVGNETVLGTIVRLQKPSRL